MIRRRLLLELADGIRRAGPGEPISTPSSQWEASPPANVAGRVRSRRPPSSPTLKSAPAHAESKETARREIDAAFATEPIDRPEPKVPMGCKLCDSGLEHCHGHLIEHTDGFRDCSDPACMYGDDNLHELFSSCSDPSSCFQAPARTNGWRSGTQAQRKQGR